jgi:hypothetical protein
MAPYALRSFSALMAIRPPEVINSRLHDEVYVTQLEVAVG